MGAIKALVKVVPQCRTPTIMRFLTVRVHVCLRKPILLDYGAQKVEGTLIQNNYLRMLSLAIHCKAHGGC